MKFRGGIASVTLLTLSAALAAQTLKAERPLRQFKSDVSHMTSLVNANDDRNKTADETNLLERSRTAGLLTDWHLEGRFGRGREDDFAHKFAPEQDAAKQARKQAKRFERRRYELVFAAGQFTLPPELASLSGVFYADSSAYLAGGGEWNVYLESAAAAVVFVDGRPVLTRGPKATGVLRGKIRVESGHHSVMVKFTAQAAPFRVAILPLNSGSRRKNNTPYLQASPASEDMMAKATAIDFIKPVGY